MHVFVSVGATATPEQEEFVCDIEAKLRSKGLIPRTVGRNTFTSEAPLRATLKLLEECSGTVVIALERYYFEDGVEKRGGPRQVELRQVRLSTPWNQIEAAIAYSKRHPLLVLVEESVRGEGLLEAGNDWYVQRLPVRRESLETAEFEGVLMDWVIKVNSYTPPRDRLLSTSQPQMRKSKYEIEAMLKMRLMAFRFLLGICAGAVGLVAWILIHRMHI